MRKTHLVAVLLCLFLSSCTNIDHSVEKANAYLLEHKGERPLGEVVVLDAWREFPVKKCRGPLILSGVDACVKDDTVYVLRRAVRRGKLFEALLVHEGVFMIRLREFRKKQGGRATSPSRQELHAMYDEAGRAQVDYVRASGGSP